MKNTFNQFLHNLHKRVEFDSFSDRGELVNFIHSKNYKVIKHEEEALLIRCLITKQVRKFKFPLAEKLHKKFKTRPVEIETIEDEYSCIYVITVGNSSYKAAYIGSTTSFKRRLKEHLSNIQKHEKSTKHIWNLSLEIRENIYFYLLEEVDTTSKDLEAEEALWQKTFNLEGIHLPFFEKWRVRKDVQSIESNKDIPSYQTIMQKGYLLQKF